MTNKEAIEILNKWYLNATDGMSKERLGYIEGWFNEKDKKALELAIKALEERPQGGVNNVFADTGDTTLQYIKLG